MILQSERLKIVSLSFNELVDYVTSRKGFVKSEDDEMKVWEKTIIPMSNDKIENHPYYTFWVGYLDGKDILQVGVLAPVNEYGVVEIWVEVNEQYRGNGFGGEAMTALIEWLRNNEKVLFVGASIEPSNEASRKMTLKCGFEYACDTLGMNIFFYNMKNTN